MVGSRERRRRCIRSSDGSVRFDEHPTLPSRPLIGCLAVAPAEGELHAMLQGRYGGNLDCKDLVAGATLVLPFEHAGAGLYFGDCKALMGDGEIVGPPEVGALVTATAELRAAAGVAALAAARDGRRASRRSSPARRSSGPRGRRSASCSTGWSTTTSCRATRRRC